MKQPSAILEGATLLAYTIVDSTLSFAGKLHLYHGSERIGQVPALAICQDEDADGLFVFHCSKDWDVLGAQLRNTSPETAMRTVEEVEHKVEL